MSNITLLVFGALLVLGGILYMVRTAIWWGSLSRPSVPVSDTLEPSRRGVRFLGLGANWPGILLMVIGAVLLLSGASF
jgi:hypothetical protein